MRAYLSQRELADKLGVAQPTVSAWENGDGYPRVEKLMQLAQILGCTVDDLLASPNR